MERIVGEVQEGDLGPVEGGGVEPGEAVTGEVEGEAPERGGEEGGGEGGEGGVTGHHQQLQLPELCEGLGLEILQGGNVGDVDLCQGLGQTCRLLLPHTAQVELAELDAQERGQGLPELQLRQVEIVVGDVESGEEGQSGGVSVLGTVGVRGPPGEAGEVGVGEVQRGEPGARGEVAERGPEEDVMTEPERLELWQAWRGVVIFLSLL